MGPKTAKVYDEIRERILSGEWGPTDKLPSERELSESMSIGRTALRQVLSRLTTEGLIETHSRSGYRVTNDLLDGSIPVPWELLEELQDRHGLSPAGFRHALERVVINLVPVGDGEYEIHYRVPMS